MHPRFDPPTGRALAEVDSGYEGGVVYDDHCIVIEGVVGLNQSVWCRVPGRYDAHVFTLAIWRRLGQALVQRELVVLRPVPPHMSDGGETPRELFSEIPEYSVQRFSALLSKDGSRAVFERILPCDDADGSLAIAASALREPVIITTDHFGQLLLDPTTGWFKGKTKWGRRTIEIALQRGPDDRIDGALGVAERLWSEPGAWKRKVEDFAIAKLLPLKNDSWLEPSESKVTAKEFKARIKLRSISVARDGHFDFWHEDGGLFSGHSIQVGGNLAEGPTEADIPG